MEKTRARGLSVAATIYATIVAICGGGGIQNATKRKLLLTALLTAPIALGGCGQGDNFVCPSVSANVTFQSYGSYSFSHEGDDSTARRIISECGWHVYGGHNGGFGDTLQIASPNEAVIFVWAWNNFVGFTVQNGWTGKTDRGTKLGDSQATVIGLYPELPVSDGAVGPYVSADNCTEFNPHFDKPGGSLTEIDVSDPLVWADGAPSIPTCHGY